MYLKILSVKSFSLNLYQVAISTLTSSSQQSGMLILKKLNVKHWLSFYTAKVTLNISKRLFFQTVRHYNLFPKSIGEIVQKHSLRELHLSLTQSLWRTHKWGYPVRHAGPGAEVFATFYPQLTK